MKRYNAYKRKNVTYRSSSDINSENAPFAMAVLFDI